MPSSVDRELVAALSAAAMLRLELCARIVRRRVENALRRLFCLSLREAWVLLAANCHKPVTQKQIATHLTLNQNVMVSLVDKLESSGHVRRLRNPANRREQFVRLTAKGRTVVRRLLTERTNIYREALAPLDGASINALLERSQTFLAFESGKSIQSGKAVRVK